MLPEDANFAAYATQVQPNLLKDGSGSLKLRGVCKNYTFNDLNDLNRNEIIDLLYSTGQVLDLVILPRWSTLARIGGCIAPC